MKFAFGFVPTWSQWKKWTLPSKWSVVSAYLAFGVLLFQLAMKNRDTHQLIDTLADPR